MGISFNLGKLIGGFMVNGVEILLQNNTLLDVYYILWLKMSHIILIGEMTYCSPGCDMRKAGNLFAKIVVKLSAQLLQPHLNSF